MSELSDRVKEIYEQYKDIDFKQEIKKELWSINDYAQALDDGAFLVVILGNTNAGKSTFCNVLAHNDICQTDSEECTKKPLFITKGDNVYSTFKKQSGVSEDKKILFEKILSRIVKDNGEEIDGVEIESVPISKETIIDSNKNNDYFLTSVAVDEKGLVRDKIFFVDMPGLNGQKSHFDDFQKIVLQRADYIIFILNSTVTTIQSDNNVLEYIAKYNSDVMFSVLLNLYETDVFDVKKTDRENAKKKLKNVFKTYPFSTLRNKNEELSDVIDLKYVYNHLHNSSTEAGIDIMLNEYNRFSAFINLISENVINKSDEIRKPNVEKNIRDRVADLVKQIDVLILEHENKIRQYDDFVSNTEDLPELIGEEMQYDSEYFKIDTENIKSVNKLTIDVTTEYDGVKKYIEDFIDSLRNKVVDSFDETLKGAKAKISKAIGSKLNALNNRLYNKLKLQTKVKPKSFESESFEKEIRSRFVKVTEVLEEPNWLKEMFRWLPGVMEYSPKEFDKIVSSARSRIINDDNSKAQMLETLEDKFNDDLKRDAVSFFGKTKDEIVADINKRCEDKKNSIIPDYEKYCEDRDNLVRLKTELERLESV